MPKSPRAAEEEIAKSKLAAHLTTAAAQNTRLSKG